MAPLWQRRSALPSLFYATQRDRLAGLGVDVDGYDLSHLAFRTSTMSEYIDMRTRLEEHSTAIVENVWNGRRISKLVLRDPLYATPETGVASLSLSAWWVVVPQLF